MKLNQWIRLSFLTAAGIVLQILESFIPISWVVPGFKIGFANVIGLFALQAYGIRSMWIVTLLRIFLASLLQGTLFGVSFWMSLAGGVFALTAMSLTYAAKRFSLCGTGVAGACFHSIGQVMTITWIYQQYFMQLYLPILLALSIVSGLCTGWLAHLVLQRMKGV